LEGVKGVDHTNPKSWTGDIRTCNISLLTVWNAGRRQAVGVFKALKVKHKDFATLPDNIDIMRPFGEYVSLRESDIDFCLDFVNESLDPEALTPQSETLTLTTDDQLPSDLPALPTMASLKADHVAKRGTAPVLKEHDTLHRSIYNGNYGTTE
jgi:hypothetical protein